MNQSFKRGFTLVELLMVIAIVSIIATLAISKFSGIKLDSEKRVSYANIQRISTAVDAFVVAGNKVNALDSLLDYPAQNSITPFGDFEVTTNYFATGTGKEGENIGISFDLRRQLCMYYLSTNDISALNRAGMNKTYLSLNSRSPVSGNFDEVGDMMVGVANSPLMSSCYGKKINVGLGVAMVNPFTPDEMVYGANGFTIYRDMGIDIRVADGDRSFLVNGKECLTMREVFNKLMEPNGDGILLAFGLGDNGSMIGNANAGIDKAPTCPIVRKDEYPRYILLFRLRTLTGRANSQEREFTFAGVLDSYGQTAAAAKKTL